MNSFIHGFFADRTFTVLSLSALTVVGYLAWNYYLELRAQQLRRRERVLSRSVRRYRRARPSLPTDF